MKCTARHFSFVSRPMEKYFNQPSSRIFRTSGKGRGGPKVDQAQGGQG